MASMSDIRGISFVGIALLLARQLRNGVPFAIVVPGQAPHGSLRLSCVIRNCIPSMPDLAATVRLNRANRRGIRSGQPTKCCPSLF